VGQTCFTPPFFVERRHKMGIRDWDIVTSYVDSVTTSLKTVTFPKVQEQVKVKNQGNANLTYTIGSQSGTLTPGQSVTVNEDISSFTIQAASGTQAFELRAKEKGTEQTEDNSSDVMSLLVDINTFYRKPKTGKKIVFIGDSTTDTATGASAIYARLSSMYTTIGGLLEGATIVPRGSNGGTLQNFIANFIGPNGAYSGNTLDACVSDQADLYVLSYGINDIRGGVNSPGRTATQIRADLKTAIDNLLTQTKGNVLLRIPNTFLTTDVNGNGYISPNSTAQDKSNQLYDIYESFRGYSPRLDIIDIPNLVFGRKSLSSHVYMTDQLHPSLDGYRAIADEIAEWIGGQKNNKLYDMDEYEVVMKGSIEGTVIDNTKLSFYTMSTEDVKKGDIVVVGNKFSFVVNKKAVKTATNKWFIFHDHIGEYTKYGTVKILRKKDRPNNNKNSLNNWVRGYVSNAGDTQVFLETVIDLQAVGVTYTGSISIENWASYYTEDIGITTIKHAYYFNNNATVGQIFGGVTQDGVSNNITRNAITQIYDTRNVAVNGNRYLHMLVVVAGGSGTKKSFEYGDLMLVLGGIDISTDAITWTAFSAEADSKVYNNIYRRDTLLTYGEMRAELKRLGLIS
jgi:lysophospholipase L1-like esterase